ncbi:MAG TPA: NAD(P)-dependent oxidoreductase [Chloroflexota bacterium]|nr:NAD(P)-dependent oxidoreductase [Chloroflexota bacterium]
MKVLVTGAGGRIGRMLVTALVERGHDVNALELQQHPSVRELQKMGPGVRVFRGSVEYYAEVEPAVAGVDAVYHLGAAMGSFTDNQFFHSNVTGTFNVLQAVRRVAPGLKRFCFPSSDAVYEKYVPGGLKEPIDPERTTRDGKGLYAFSKIAGEEMCWSYLRTYGIPCVVFRFPIARGAAELPEFYELWLDGLLNYKRGQIRADPDAPRAVEILERLQKEAGGERRLVVARDARGRSYQRVYVDVRDVVSALLAALDADAAVGHSFPVGGKDQPAKSEAIVPYLSEKLGVPYVEAKLPGIPTYYAHDDRQTRRLLRYKPRYSVFDMIDEALGSAAAATLTSPAGAAKAAKAAKAAAATGAGGGGGGDGASTRKAGGGGGRSSR